MNQVRIVLLHLLSLICSQIDFSASFLQNVISSVQISMCLLYLCPSEEDIMFGEYFVSEQFHWVYTGYSFVRFSMRLTSQRRENVLLLPLFRRIEMNKTQIYNATPELLLLWENTIQAASVKFVAKILDTLCICNFIFSAPYERS